MKASKKLQPEQERTTSISFPGESAEYRAARDRLLTREIELRRALEAVAAERRKLPPGGVVPQDYVFKGTGADGAPLDIKLSELFAAGKDTLVIYNFMYGPEMDQPCPMCTSILDALDGNAEHISQRVNLAVVAKSPLPRIRAFADGRGWRRLRLLSSADNSYNRDYFGESEKGSQQPMLNVFRRDGGEIRHFWGSELMFAPTDRGQDSRHVDLITPLWNVFDCTPEGRPTDWRPKLSYSQTKEEQLMLKNAPISPYIPVSDLQRARKFYEEKVGIGPGKEYAGGVIYACGNGTRVFMYKSAGAGTSKANYAFWQVEDVEAEVAELKKRGVVFEEYDMPGIKTENSIATGGGAKTAWFKDSEGNILAVSQTL